MLLANIQTTQKLGCRLSFLEPCFPPLVKTHLHTAQGTCCDDTDVWTIPVCPSHARQGVHRVWWTHWFDPITNACLGCFLVFAPIKVFQ